MQIDLIIVLTNTGKLARFVSKYKPSVAILACTQDFLVFKNLSVVRGVIPLEVKDHEKDWSVLITKAKALNLIKGPCKVITLLEAETKDYEKANEMKIVDVE